MADILRAERPGHGRAPVTTLCEVAVVSEAGHQHCPCIGDAFDTPARRRRLAREPETRQRRADHVKRIARLTSVVGRVGQRLDDLVELDDRSRPPVGHHEWARCSMWRSLMDEVNVDAIDGGDELVEAVQSRLSIAPVVLVAPIAAHVLDPGQRRALAPVVDGLGVGPPGLGEAMAQIVERVLRHVDSKRTNGSVV